MNPVLFYAPDAYVLDGPKLMGRHSAGNGFLRAAVRGHAGRPIHALTTSRASAESFRDVVLGIDAGAQPRPLQSYRLAELAQHGLLFRPDINLMLHARERLRQGPAAYSLCGVTHTLSTHGPAEVIAEMLVGPVMPWDALICTSKAALGVVETLLAAQEDYLAWRFGQRPATPRPQLPVIPLGVHPQDFAFSADDRARARAGLKIAADEVMALFAGRLAFNGKAHPYQMLTGLERVARATGRKLVLVQAGQFPTRAAGEVYRSAAAAWAPSVRCLFVDGADAAAFADAWRAADIFVSLSDNIQETFGITPLEAMAAGLPVLVTDWNGYRDTVRDGQDGFRIPTWAPPPGAGAEMACAYETGWTDYEHFLSRTSTTTSVDPRILFERLAALAADPDLRRTVGEAGRERVRREYDWAVVYRQYEALWREQDEIRARLGGDPALRAEHAPRAAPARADPFALFAGYPTRHLGPQTRVSAVAGASAAAYQGLTSHLMHSFWREPPELVGRTLAACAGEGGASLEAIAASLGEPIRHTLERVARLAKLELVMLQPAAEG